MKKTALIITSLTSCLLSCGPSKQDIELEKYKKQDSIAKVAEAEIQEKRKMDSVAEATKNAIANSIAEEESASAEAEVQVMLSQQLMELNASLEVAQSKLVDIKQPKLFRTPEEKEQQILEQVLIIETLKKDIKDTQKQLK